LLHRYLNLFLYNFLAHRWLMAWESSSIFTRIAVYATDVKSEPYLVWHWAEKGLVKPSGTEKCRIDQVCAENKVFFTLFSTARFGVNVVIIIFGEISHFFVRNLAFFSWKPI
jgi:hypothetical protein